MFADLALVVLPRLGPDRRSGASTDLFKWFLHPNNSPVTCNNSLVYLVFLEETYH